MKSPVWMAALLALFCGCGQNGGGDAGEGGAGSKGGRSYQIAVIPKGESHEFWKSIHAGANKAARELGAEGVEVDVKWKGPAKEDDRAEQIALVEGYAVRKVDAIVLAPLDATGLVAPVERAIKASVPVVVIDSGLNSDLPVSYVATDNFKGGRMGAEHLAKLLDGKGNVIVLRYQPGSASTEMREAGFLDVITNNYPGIKVLSENQWSGATRDSAYKAAQNLMQIHGGEVDGVFAPCEPVTIGVMLALKDIKRNGGVVKLVGFDAGTTSVAGLKAGDIQGLVVQDPVRMGYLGVRTAVMHLMGQPIEKVIDTGVVMVTLENMDAPGIVELLNPPLDEYLN